MPRRRSSRFSLAWVPLLNQLGFAEATITYGRVIDSIFGLGGYGSDRLSFSCPAWHVVLGMEVATAVLVNDEFVAGVRLLCGPSSAQPPAVGPPRWTAWMGRQLQGTIRHGATCPCGTFLEAVAGNYLPNSGLVTELEATCSAAAVGKPRKKSFTLFEGRISRGFTVRNTSGFSTAPTLSAIAAMLQLPGRIPSCSYGQVVLGLEVATRRAPFLTQPRREVLAGARFYCGDPATALCTRR